AEARQLRAYNPLVQRGVGVRNAYIWQDAIQYPEGAKRIVEKPLNEQQFFGEEACEELEATLSTDGQYFILVDTAAQEVRRIPFSEITGVYRNPEHNAEIWYYRRTYSRLQTDEATGVTQNDVVEEWHPAITYDGAAKSEILGKPVNKTVLMEHARVNTMVGTPWGIPNLMGAVYWAGAYKRYLEASYTLSKALARLAFK